MARVVSYSSGPANYAELAQRILDETGFEARVDENFQLFFVADDAGAAKLEAALPEFTLNQGEEGSQLAGSETLFNSMTDEQKSAAISLDPNAADDVTGDPGDIMQGGQATRIVVPGGKDQWAVTYMADGIEHVYTFDSKESMIKGMGAEWAEGGVKVLQQDEVDDGDTWIIGAGEAMVGQGDQQYTAYWTSIKEDAALEAGVRNPGLIGEYLSDPDVQRIMAEGAAADWSEERIQADIRGTNFYQNVLYPGIITFLEKGEANPEQAYNEYMSSVDSALSQLGYERDPDGSYRSLVGNMLGKGISSGGFNTFAQVFKRAEASQDFASQLSKWTEQDMGQALTFENWLDVVNGDELDSELAGVVEKATLAFNAEQQGFDAGDSFIERLAGGTDLSEQGARAAFEGIQADLIALGDAGLKKVGLTVDDVASSGAGIKAASGRSISEIKQLASKAVQELGLADDKKAQLYVGYNPRGAPNRPGLQTLAGESG